MTDYKILFTGSVCSGKTTAIRSLSAIETVDTDANVSDSAIRRKQKTTIAMDYGVLELSDDARLHLYGTPGQERFKFMWQLITSDLAHDAEALILLVDNTRNDPFKDIRFYVDEFRDYLVRRRLIIAVTHSDQSADPNYQFYMNELKKMGLFTTVFFIDARDPAAVMTVVKEVLGRREKNIDWPALTAKLVAGKRLLDIAEGEEEPVEEEEPQVSLLEAAMNLRGITGAMQLDAERKELDSNVEHLQSKALLKAMVNMVSALESKIAFMGSIDSLILCGPEQETLSLFLEKEQALGLCANKELSLTVIKEQAADLLQWSEK